MSACRPMLSSSPSVVSSLSVAEGRGEPETNGSNQTIFKFNADENQFLHLDTGYIILVVVVHFPYLQLASHEYRESYLIHSLVSAQ